MVPLVLEPGRLTDRCTLATVTCYDTLTHCLCVTEWRLLCVNMPKILKEIWKLTTGLHKEWCLYKWVHKFLLSLRVTNTHILIATMYSCLALIRADLTLKEVILCRGCQTSWALHPHSQWHLLVIWKWAQSRPLPCQQKYGLLVFQFNGCKYSAC